MSLVIVIPNDPGPGAVVASPSGLNEQRIHAVVFEGLAPVLRPHTQGGQLGDEGVRREFVADEGDCVIGERAFCVVQ